MSRQKFTIEPRVRQGEAYNSLYGWLSVVIQVVHIVVPDCRSISQSVSPQGSFCGFRLCRLPHQPQEIMPMQKPKSLGMGWRRLYCLTLFLSRCGVLELYMLCELFCSCHRERFQKALRQLLIMSEWTINVVDITRVLDIRSIWISKSGHGYGTFQE